MLWTLGELLGREVAMKLKIYCCAESSNCLYTLAPPPVSRNFPCFARDLEADVRRIFPRNIDLNADVPWNTFNAARLQSDRHTC